MPKLLVMFQADDRAAESLAEAAAEGARGVRFMEVDQRVVGSGAGRGKPLGPTGLALDYDGIIVVANDAGAGAGTEAMDAFLRELGEDGKTADMVFALLGNAAPALAASWTKRGGILVGVADRGDALAHAKATGARAARVAGWVRHALGHEAEHHHAHSGDVPHKHEHKH